MFVFKVERKRAYYKIMEFLNRSERTLNRYLEPIVFETLKDKKDELSDLLTSGKLQLAPLRESTIKYKEKLQKRGMISNPTFPLVRFKQLAENMYINKKSATEYTFSFWGKKYFHYDTPRRTSGRTILDIALIHKSGNLGKTFVIRDLFDEYRKLIQKTLVSRIKSRLKAFVRGF